MKKLLEKLNKNKITYSKTADFKDVSYIKLQHDISLLIYLINLICHMLLLVKQPILI